MTIHSRRQQFLLAVLVAALLAIFIGRLNASADHKPDAKGPRGEDSLAIREPDLCNFLDPYTYWWGWWGCEERERMRAAGIALDEETITVERMGDVRRVLIERRFSDGSVQSLERWTVAQ